MARKPATATARMESARSVTQRALDREICLVSMLTRMPGFDAHLSPPRRPQEHFPFVVCVHTPAGQLAWRVHDDEVPLFAHLEKRANDGDSYSADDKLSRLLLLAAEGW